MAIRTCRRCPVLGGIDWDKGHAASASDPPAALLSVLISSLQWEYLLCVCFALEAAIDAPLGGTEGALQEQLQGSVGYRSKNCRMEALIFFACLVFATLVIVAGLYGTCRDTPPDRGAAPYRRVCFWNFR